MAQSKRQVAAGKKYQALKDARNLVSGITPSKDPKKGGKLFYFYIADQSRKERKTTFEKIMKNWFRHWKD